MKRKRLKRTIKSSWITLWRKLIIDVLKDVLPELDMDEGRRLTLVEECHERWVENARNLRNGNGKDSGKEVRP